MFRKRIIGLILATDSANHFTENLVNLPLDDDVMSTRVNLIKWGIDIHNIVNESRNKQIIEYRNNKARLQSIIVNIKNKSYLYFNFALMDKNGKKKPFKRLDNVETGSLPRLNLLNLRRNEVLGSHHADKMEFTEKQKTDYDQFWKDLNSGKTKKEQTKFIVNSKKMAFLEVYTPIMDENGTVKRILKISNNISEFNE